jgi:hypothetical protein
MGANISLFWLDDEADSKAPASIGEEQLLAVVFYAR